jgi:hypothetical protein
MSKYAITPACLEWWNLKQQVERKRHLSTLPSTSPIVIGQSIAWNEETEVGLSKISSNSSCWVHLAIESCWRSSRKWWSVNWSRRRNKHVCRIWRKSWKGLTLCIHHSDWSPASFSLCCQLFENGYTLWEKFVQLFSTFAIYVGLMGTCLFIPEVLCSIDGYSFRNKKNSFTVGYFMEWCFPGFD